LKYESIFVVETGASVLVVRNFEADEELEKSWMNLRLELAALHNFCAIIHKVMNSTGWRCPLLSSPLLPLLQQEYKYGAPRASAQWALA
jgi:hypothetical protein